MPPRKSHCTPENTRGLPDCPRGSQIPPQCALAPARVLAGHSAVLYGALKTPHCTLQASHGPSVFSRASAYLQQTPSALYLLLKALQCPPSVT